MAGILPSGLLNHSKLLSKNQQVGFTLLELLIVIFIISLISAGFIKLSVGFSSATQSLEDETRRLHRLLNLTAQEAILNGGRIGLLIESDTYHFVSPGQQNRWEIIDDDILKSHQLPQGWSLELKQDDQVVSPAVIKEGDPLPSPSIIFYASGEMTAFQLSIYPAGYPDPSLIEAKENGEIEMRFPELNQ